MNIKWSDSEKNFIKEHAKDMKDEEIAIELSKRSGRKITLNGVRKVRQNLGIKKIAGRGKCGVVSLGGNDDVRDTTHIIHQFINS